MYVLILTDLLHDRVEQWLSCARCYIKSNNICGVPTKSLVCYWHTINSVQ